MIVCLRIISACYATEGDTLCTWKGGWYVRYDNKSGPDIYSKFLCMSAKYHQWFFPAACLFRGTDRNIGWIHYLKYWPHVSSNMCSPNVKRIKWFPIPFPFCPFLNLASPAAPPDLFTVIVDSRRIGACWFLFQTPVNPISPLTTATATTAERPRRFSLSVGPR